MKITAKSTIRLFFTCLVVFKGSVCRIVLYELPFFYHFICCWSSWQNIWCVFDCRCCLTAWHGAAVTSLSKLLIVWERRRTFCPIEEVFVIHNRPLVATTSAAWFVARQSSGDRRGGGMQLERPSNSKIVVTDNSWRGVMCVPDAGPQGIISQRPACHSLQWGRRRSGVTEGWMEITCWSHKSKRKKFPPEPAQQSSMLTPEQVGKTWLVKFKSSAWKCL